MTNGIDPNAVIMLIMLSLLVGVFVVLVFGASGCVWL